VSSSRTLAERFRSQRTDRIRVEGTEVLSIVELVLRPTSALELVVESQRDDVEQEFFIRSRAGQAHTLGDTHSVFTSEPVELVELRSRHTSRIELVGQATDDTVFHLWNGWRIGGTAHSWTGNCGIVVEDLTPPPGANLRFRLWCSDGLGDPSFDDLVVLVTVGDQSPQ